MHCRWSRTPCQVPAAFQKPKGIRVFINNSSLLQRRVTEDSRDEASFRKRLLQALTLRRFMDRTIQNPRRATLETLERSITLLKPFRLFLRASIFIYTKSGSRYSGNTTAGKEIRGPVCHFVSTYALRWFESPGRNRTENRHRTAIHVTSRAL